MSIESRIFFPSRETPITPLAFLTLRSWGMSAHQIHAFAEVVGEFDGAYKRCPEKINSIQRVYSQYDTITIPDIGNGIYSGIGGNCNGINELLLDRFAQTHVLDGTRTKIVPYFVDGPAPGAFSDQHANHAWISLNKMIVVDGSYQKIACRWESGYHADTPILPSRLHRNQNLTLRESDIYIHANGIRVFTSNDTILGLSDDESVSFALGFVRENHTLVPFIRSTHQNGVDSLVHLINPYSGHIHHDHNKSFFRMTDSSMEELTTMLNSLSTLEEINTDD